MDCSRISNQENPGLLGNVREPIDQDNGQDYSVLNSLRWKKSENAKIQYSDRELEINYREENKENTRLRRVTELTRNAKLVKKKQAQGLIKSAII